MTKTAMANEVPISIEDAKVITDMMEELWRRRELSDEEERAFLTLCSRAGFGRPVPDHASGP
jgi:hypothetical protein